MIRVVASWIQGPLDPTPIQAELCAHHHVLFGANSEHNAMTWGYCAICRWYLTRDEAM